MTCERFVICSDVKREAAAEGSESSDSDDDVDSPEGCTLFVKNLNFETADKSLKKVGESNDLEWKEGRVSSGLP